MSGARTLAQVFETAPTQWGLRGDPYLWQELRDMLSDHVYPATEDDLAKLLERTFQRLTGAPITHPTPIFVERYSHGGMSSGMVSPQFWTEEAFPLLRDRYRAAR